MNTTSQSSPYSPASLPGSSWKKKLLIVLAVIVACCGITAAATAWWVKRNVYASPFRPVSLSQTEQKAFDEKVEVLSGKNADIPAGAGSPAGAGDDKRTLVVTDKEINAYLAKQGLGDQIKVELNEGTAAATLIAPVDNDVPVIGGKTFRIRVGLATGGKPDGGMSLAINDVSIGGVPVPNAWLGDVKGVNLLAGSAGSDPVVKRFLAGIHEFQINGGSIRVQLNE